jgi:lipocalin
MYWLLAFGFILFINKSMACTTPSLANLTVQSNFSLHHFLGLWYEIKWLPGEVHNESDIWHDYSQSFELENNSTNRLLVLGRARLPNEDKCFSFGPWLIIANNSAKMFLEKESLNSTTILNWPYFVLKTDYDHYALIYGCMSENYTHTNQCEEPILWVFSRTIVLSNEYLDEYIENTLCINLTELELTPHREKSCYISSGLTICSIDLILLLILNLFYIYF